ncbi:MAG: amino acid permease [Candidatus Wallbacteria bacterium]|nr:amino acid permease [Candidatus Wallbacteria bacterium]
MGGFANFAVSFSIISILSGAITSFDLGLASVGPAQMGIGWPVVCLFSLATAMAMAEIASAFPTAGGLYHWAAILGGNGWGWWTAWFNLIGLVTVLAAIDFGAAAFLLGWAGPLVGLDLAASSPAAAQAWKVALTAAFLLSQGWINHRGIRLTALVTDLSAWVHMAGAALLTASLLGLARAQPVGYLFEWINLTGSLGEAGFPRTESMPWAFVLGMLMAAYTFTGYDASAHTAEETVDAANKVPWGMVMAVVVSGVFGYLMLVAVTLSVRDPRQALASGGAVIHVMRQGLPEWLSLVLLGIISLAQYSCGLATVTSLSRMIYAFARDGGLPGSHLFSRVSPATRTPAHAIWLGSGLALAFTLYTPVYATITCVATISLYISYAIPLALGLRARGVEWKQMGPWTLGRIGPPVAATAVAWVAFVCVILVQPPNRLALWTMLACAGLLALYWFAYARRTFQGPPRGLLSRQRQAELQAVEDRLSGQTPQAK